jgi:hypothetical protein
MRDQDIEGAAEVGLKLAGAGWGALLGGAIGGPVGMILGGMASYGISNAMKMLENDREVDPAHPYPYL